MLFRSRSFPTYLNYPFRFDSLDCRRNFSQSIQWNIPKKKKDPSLPQPVIVVLEDTKIPLDLFKCPITHQIPSDPVLASDGYTYERAAITEYLRESRENDANSIPLSPATHQPLSDLSLRPNFLAKKLIQLLQDKDIIEKRPCKKTCRQCKEGVCPKCNGKKNFLWIEKESS